MNSKLFSKNRGFTLIELLIVIAIILILIAIALPNFLEAQIRARVTNAKGGLRAMETAFQEHILDWGIIPADFNDSLENTKNGRTHGGYFAGPCSRVADQTFYTDGGLTFDPNINRGRFYANNMHCPLTTPIQYLPPESTFDIFGDGTVPLGYDSREINDKIIYGAFWSAGPDRYAGHWLRFRADVPGDYNGDGCADALPYSPTNGTVSKGEFWGVVGDWSYAIDPNDPCATAANEYSGIQRTY